MLSSQALCIAQHPSNEGHCNIFSTYFRARDSCSKTSGRQRWAKHVSAAQPLLWWTCLEKVNRQPRDNKDPEYTRDPKREPWNQRQEVMWPKAPTATWKTKENQCDRGRQEQDHVAQSFWQDKWETGSRQRGNKFETKTSGVQVGAKWETPT